MLFLSNLGVELFPAKTVKMLTPLHSSFMIFKKALDRVHMRYYFQNIAKENGKLQLTLDIKYIQTIYSTIFSFDIDAALHGFIIHQEGYNEETS